MKIFILLFTTSLLSFTNSNAQTAPGFPDRMSLSERVNISGIASGEIEKELLLNSKGLSLSGKSSATSHVTSFRMTLVGKEGEASREFFNEVDGELLPTMLDAIKNAPAGSKLFFEYIKSTGPDNTTHSIHPANFILK